jgi:hypothetical protein
MRFHRFDFPDLPLDAFKHYGDRRIKPQGPPSIPDIAKTISDVVSAPFQPQSSGGGGGGGGGWFGSFLGNPLGTTIDTASSLINDSAKATSDVIKGASDTLHQVTAPILDPVSDVIHEAGTAVAKSPLLSTAAVIALTPYIGAPAAAALVSANAGAKPETIVKNMVMAGVAAEVAQQVAPEVSSMTGSGNAGAVAGQAAGSATTAALIGRDPIQAALNATITSGVSVGTGEILKDVEGFQDLTPAQQKAVATVVSAELQGKDPTAALISQALEVGRQTVRDTLNTKIDEADFGVNQGTVDKLAELQAREEEAEDAARAAEAKRLADEENIRQIEAARAEQGATNTTEPTNTEAPPAVDESYLSKLSPADLERYKAMQAGIDTVPDIKPQDLGVTQENIDSYEKTQQENADAGKLPSQWVTNQDGSGTSTMVHDDGSTTTIDDKGDIVYTTEAPAGNLISDPATQTPQTGGSTVKAPSGTTKATDQLFSSMPTAQKSVVMNMANSGTPLAEAVTAASAFTPVGIKTSTDAGGSKFEGPLDTFLKMVKESDYSKKPVEAQNQQGPNVQQDLLSQPSNYFSYGQPTEIDQLISGEVPNFAAKAGGLAVPMMAAGGNTRYGKYAGGGLNVVNHSGKARLDFRKGDAVTGPGDGQSDDIPAMLADGEFVFPADVVAALGNGSTKAGSDKLYDMMHSIREYHRAAKPKDLPPPAKKSPLDYLKSKKARR